MRFEFELNKTSNKTTKISFQSVLAEVELCIPKNLILIFCKVRSLLTVFKRNQVTEQRPFPNFRIIKTCFIIKEDE